MSGYGFGTLSHPSSSLRPERYFRKMLAQAGLWIMFHSYGIYYTTIQLNFSLNSRIWWLMHLSTYCEWWNCVCKTRLLGWALRQFPERIVTHDALHADSKRCFGVNIGHSKYGHSYGTQSVVLGCRRFVLAALRDDAIWSVARTAMSSKISLIFLPFVFKIFWILLINVVEMFLPHISTQVSWKYYDYFLLFWGFKVVLF
jgi:hypothetical protein